MSDCSQCKLHTTSFRPKVAKEASFGSLVEFEDGDEVVYHCRAPAGPYAGREIGVVPVTCSAFQAGSKCPEEVKVELDGRIAAWAARLDRKERQNR